MCLFGHFVLLSENTNEAPHLKHDGTPDMRYAENQQQEGVAHPHLKADGAPDLRFAENQQGAAPTATGKFVYRLKCIVEWFPLLCLLQLLPTNNHSI